MKTMIELLRDADPLLHEARTTMDQRDSRRKALLAAASIPHDRAGANPRSRATLLVTLGFAMIVVISWRTYVDVPFPSRARKGITVTCCDLGKAAEPVCYLSIAEDRLWHRC